MRELGLGLGWELSAGGVAIPAGAVSVPADSGLDYQNAVSLGLTIRNFSAGAWFRIDSMPEVYISLLTIQKQTAPGVNEYFWLGHDSTAGGGNRGLSVADNQGAHSYQLLPALGTWFHVGVTKSGNTVKVYQNGVLVDWDTAAPGVNYTTNLGQASYVNIERLRWCNEQAAGQDFVGAIRSAFFTHHDSFAVMTDAEMAAVKSYSDPHNYGPSWATRAGSLANPAWPLTGPSSLTSPSSGEVLTVYGGPLGSTTKPAGITLP